MFSIDASQFKTKLSSLLAEAGKDMDTNVDFSDKIGDFYDIHVKDYCQGNYLADKKKNITGCYGLDHQDSLANFGHPGGGPVLGRYRAALLHRLLLCAQPRLVSPIWHPAHSQDGTLPAQQPCQSGLGKRAKQGLADGQLSSPVACVRQRLAPAAGISTTELKRRGPSALSFHYLPGALCLPKLHELQLHALQS